MNIAILTGDGIGPEIMAEAVKTLDAAQERFGLKVTVSIRDPVAAAPSIGMATLCRKKRSIYASPSVPSSSARSTGRNGNRCRRKLRPERAALLP